jgi:DNA modification methylase
MQGIEAESVDLVVTSPPYPMIEMWDESFCAVNGRIEEALAKGQGQAAFELMHQELDRVWTECHRVLRPGGFLCVNIGDATRKVKDNFRLYSNHSRIVEYCVSTGFQSLPAILWRKQTNGPNKFMGSGMLPAGAYVTLEHEYVLVFRKDGKRVFTKDESQRRRRSAFFWEERNRWFSDVWELKGVRQLLPANEARARSAAYPLELVSRIINMYSLQGDTVLDPFLGTGTTTAAAIINGRNSIGFELLRGFEPLIHETVKTSGRLTNQLVSKRLNAHADFVKDIESRRDKPLGHTNDAYGFRVMTRQETDLRLLKLDRLWEHGSGRFIAEHSVAGLDANSHYTEFGPSLAEEDGGRRVTKPAADSPEVLQP